MATDIYGREDASSSNVGVLREPLIDAKSAAILLGIPRSSVYEYAKRGELPHVKIGKHVKFVRSDLERVVVERRVGA
jgi:excisionase family DNA binding protein